MNKNANRETTIKITNIAEKTKNWTELGFLPFRALSSAILILGWEKILFPIISSMSASRWDSSVELEVNVINSPEETLPFEVFLETKFPLISRILSFIYLGYAFTKLRNELSIFLARDISKISLWCLWKIAFWKSQVTSVKNLQYSS